MARKKKNACPNCDELIREGNHGRFENIYFAGRDLTADVRCPNCHELVCISGGAADAMHIIKGSK